jgi:hypothetical protein
MASRAGRMGLAYILAALEHRAETGLQVVAPGKEHRLMRVTYVALMLLLLLPAIGFADESEARYRLSVVTDALLEMGEEMLGDPVSGTVHLGDTATVEMNLSTDYSYHLHIWTDASLNLMEFWVTNQYGDVECASQGDHSSLVVFPDEYGDYVLHILLIEGWDADSVGYAAALFRYPRQVLTLVY